MFAVTGIPDEKKGERLAVLYVLDKAKLPAVLEHLGAAGLPNLFLPRKQDYLSVASLPMLGTGKADLQAVKRAAVAALSASND